MARRSSSQSLMAAGILVIALVVGVFMWQPVRQDVGALTEGLSAKEVQLSTLQSDIAELVRLNESLPVAETERIRILKAVPVGLNQDNLILDLDRIAQALHLSLGSMSFSLQGAADHVNKISVVGNFTGRYEDLIALLQALETNERLFQVTSVGVQLSELTDDGDQLMNFSVTLEAYYQ